ncbi:helix-turn-helix transcriptional regulator [Acetobacterium wieringae]|uniref:helix-turn-helix domain-containing protein n=1 Tax=Acetobacterium wieringae TaxID=52694 RepID=UPI0031590C91
MDNTIGSKIRFLRNRDGYTQKELAEKLNIAKSTMSQYESNNRIPSDDLKIEIANLFNVSTDYLLGRTDGLVPVRDINQDLYDEHDYTAELKSLIDDEEFRTEFLDFEDWTDEEKRNILFAIRANRALREKNEKK